MSSAYYEIYLKGVFDLASTLVIKSEDSANAINAWLSAQQRLIADPVLAAKFAVDTKEPRTWKYYMNLAGQYHPTDAMMTITSLDTQETIDFTVENLKEHRATKREFTYRSRYYEELYSRYPDQERLILGILNPIDIDQAIEADDHTILYYDKTLVEDNEITFIPMLQAWINAFFVTWNVQDYRLTDSLFVSGQWGVLFAHLPKAILNIRLANAKTDYAHSFHIKQYLTSFGRLDPYLDYLNQKQKLFFYRNIKYINLNPGKIDTFDWLTQKVLTDRRFPLAEYDIRHNNTPQPDQIYPDIEMRRTSINGLSAALGADVRSVPDVLEMESDLARANAEVETEASINIPLAMRNSRASVLQTKVLESNVLDKTDAEPFTLSEVLMSHWLYFSNVGRYTAVLSINNPGTGEMMRLTAKDAFTLYLYVYNKARGIELLQVPYLDAQRVRRVPMPTAAELRGIVDSTYVPEYFIQAALANQPDIRNYISVDAFKEICQDIHTAMLRHNDLAVYQQHLVTRGQVKQMTDRFYMNYGIDIEQGQDYESWFAERSLQIENLSELELDLLAADIYTAATGQDITTTKSLAEVHAAHLKLMGKLSSYSIQFIQQINSGSLKIVDRPYLRMGDRSVKGDHLLRIRKHFPTVRSLKAHGQERFFFPLTKAFINSAESYFELNARWDIGVNYKVVGRSFSTARGIRLGLNAWIPDEDLIDLADALQPNSTHEFGYIQTVPISNLFTSLMSSTYEPENGVDLTNVRTVDMSVPRSTDDAVRTIDPGQET